MSLRRWFKKIFLGQIETKCPKCDKKQWFKWIKDYVYHPEEPPMFGHWICCECGWSSPTEPTRLTEKVVRKKYGISFEEFAKKYILKDVKGENNGQ